MRPNVFAAYIATRDGGVTWKAQTSRTDYDLWSVQFLTDGGTGWAVGSSGTILISRPEGPISTVPPAGVSVADLIQFLSGTLPPRLFMAPEYIKRLQARTDLEAKQKKMVLEIQAIRAGAGKGTGGEGTGLSFIDNTLAIRAGIIVLILFLVQILVQLSRYNTRLAGYYEARADVLLLIGKRRWDADDYSVSDVRQLMDAFSPDLLDFGKAPSTMMDRLARLTGAGPQSGSRN